MLAVRRLGAGLCLALAAFAAPADPLPTQDLLARQQEDLRAARAYVAGSQAFTESARDAALGRIDAALERSVPWTPAGFLVEVMRITATARNGHDSVHTHGGWSPDRRLPLRLSWLADGLVVTRTAPQFAALAGRKVVALDGHGLDEVMQALRQVDGGADPSIRWVDGWMLMHPDMLHALGLARQPDRVTLQLDAASPGGQAFEVMAVPSSSLPDDVDRLGAWSGELSPKEKAAGWVPAVQTAQDPLWLGDRRHQFRLVEMPALDALYLQFRGNLDGPGGESIGAFVEQARQRLRSTALHHLVLDQRLNRGGNADLTEDLMREIGHWQRGRLYVLVGPQTFSAGIVSAALVVHEARGHAVVVGDEVGDRLRWWSETAAPVCLPNSRYCLQGSTGLWDLRRGCAGEPRCYGDRFDAAVPGLAPAIRAPMTVSDWIAGRDAAMEAVEHDLRQAPARSGDR